MAGGGDRGLDHVVAAHDEVLQALIVQPPAVRDKGRVRVTLCQHNGLPLTLDYIPGQPIAFGSQQLTLAVEVVAAAVGAALVDTVMPKDDESAKEAQATS